MYVALLAYLAFILAALMLSRIRRAGRARLELSPAFFWISASLCYCLAMPASRLLFGSEASEADLPFAVDHALAGAGILLGVFVSGSAGFFRRARETAVSAPARDQGRPVAMLAMLAIHGAFYLSWLKDVHFNFSALFAEYGYGARSWDSATIINSILVVVTNASVWVAFYECVYSRRRTSSSRLIVVSAAVLLGLFDILRGNRNNLMTLALPLVVMSFRGRPVALRRAALFAAVAWFGMYSVGVVRNWGFGRLNNVTFGSDAYDPLVGEFGTSFNVYSRVRLGGLIEGDLWYGSSYLVDSAINLVPREFWRERPLTAAQEASVTYYGRSTLGMGIGFDPVVEALANLGRLGVLPIFFLASVLVAWLEKVCDGDGAWGAVYYGALAPMFINFWRIDFATVFKMCLLHVAAAWLLLLLCRQGRRKAAALCDGREPTALGSSAAAPA